MPRKSFFIQFCITMRCLMILCFAGVFVSASGWYHAHAIVKFYALSLRMLVRELGRGGRHRAITVTELCGFYPYAHRSLNAFLVHLWSVMISFQSVWLVELAALCLQPSKLLFCWKRSIKPKRLKVFPVGSSPVEILLCSGYPCLLKLLVLGRTVRTAIGFLVHPGPITLFSKVLCW